MQIPHTAPQTRQANAGNAKRKLILAFQCYQHAFLPLTVLISESICLCRMTVMWHLTEKEIKRSRFLLTELSRTTGALSFGSSRASVQNQAVIMYPEYV